MACDTEKAETRSLASLCRSSVEGGVTACPLEAIQSLASFLTEECSATVRESDVAVPHCGTLTCITEDNGSRSPPPNLHEDAAIPL